MTKLALIRHNTHNSFISEMYLKHIHINTVLYINIPNEIYMIEREYTTFCTKNMEGELMV